MAAYQNENEKRKQELLKAFQQQQKLEEYQKNKSNLTDYIKQGNNYRTGLGTLGKTLSNSDNALISNLGDKLYTGTGQKYVDNLVSKGTNTLQTGLSNLGNKLGNTLANSNSQLAQNLGSKLLSSTGSASSLGSGTTSALGSAIGAETAGTTAAGTGSALGSAIGAEAAGTAGSTGALTGAISSAAPMVGTTGASAAGTGALAAGLTNPVTAGIIAAAMIGNQLYSSKKQKDEQALKLSQQEAAQGQNTALNNKNNAISNIEQQNNNQLVDDLKNQYLTQEQTINTPISAETQLQNSDEKQNIISDIFNKFKEGYSENRNNGFEPENLEKTDKSVWNRLGEAVGTGARVLSNPALQ